MKAKFSKSDLTYPHGSLREQPEQQVLKNIENHFGENNGKETFFDSDGYEKAMKHYYDELRVIPCSENNWKDGQELEEGKDYEIVSARNPKETAKNREQVLFAVPIEWKSPSEGFAVPIVQETEDELWAELDSYFREVYQGVANFAGRVQLRKELKSKFTIKRKQ